MERIRQVIPDKFVHKRIFIDEQSVDNTRDIARSFGWEVYDNEGIGVGDAANTALKYVESAYFATFEDDVLLAPNWWSRVPIPLIKQDVAASQGVKVSDHPTLKCFDEFVIDMHKKFGDRIYIKNVGNTIFRTKVIREIGGFPTTKFGGIDTVLARIIAREGYKWAIDHNVRCIHLRGNIQTQLRHYYRYGKTDPDYTLLNTTLMFLLSPLISTVIALSKRKADIFYVYPLMRFMVLKGFLERGI